MEKIGLFYGSSTGNTEMVAEKIRDILGEDNVELINVDSATTADVESFQNLIFGVSTWGIGDIQDDFADFMPQLEDANLEGKTVAFFGLGDQFTYADSFGDAIGMVHEAIQDKGCSFIGQIETTGYEYDASKAEIDGKFIGVLLDEDSESDLTDERLAKWCAIVKPKFQ